MDEIYSTRAQQPPPSRFGLSCSSFNTFPSEVALAQPAGAAPPPSTDCVSALLQPFVLPQQQHSAETGTGIGTGTGRGIGTDSEIDSESESLFPAGGPAPLSLCLTCGAYPHSNNDRVQPLSLGQWRCVFCGHCNTDGVVSPSPSHAHSHIEAMEYVERMPCFGSIGSNEERILHVIAIDANLLGDENLQKILYCSLVHLSTIAKVALIVLDEQLRLVRLGNQSLAPLAIDVFPTSSKMLTKQLAVLAHSNQHICTVEFLQTNFEAIFESLASTFSSSISATNAPQFCLNALVDVCVHLRNARQVSVKCVMLLEREFRVMEHKLSNRQVKCSAYVNIGKYAYKNHCTFYGLHLGIRAQNMPGTDAFVTATGGLLVSSELSNDCGFGDVLQQIFSKSTKLVLPVDIATVEFRTTSGIEVDNITGPVCSIEDVSVFREALEKEFLPESLYLDEHHFAAAIQSNGNSSESEVKRKYRKAAAGMKTHAVFCGVYPREDSNTSLVFVLRRSASEDSKVKSFWSRMKAFPTKLLQVDSTRSNKESASIFREEDFLQVIVRFTFVAADSSKRLETTKVTRVWTIRFGRSSDKLSNLLDINTPLWAFGVLRGVVADFHDDIEACFDGPRPLKSSESDYEKYRHLKRKYEQQLESWFRLVAIDWQLAPSKAIVLARYFYHALLGPLFDGPSSSPQESYQARSMFLRSSFKLAHNMLMPSLRLDINYFPKGSKNEQQTSLKSMPPDSTSLLPYTFSMLDTGDAIIVRRNMIGSVDESEFSSISAMDSICAFSRESIKSRFPACRLVILATSGTPLDRLLLSKLSPSHIDTSDNILRRLQACGIRDIPADVISTLASKMPITDQVYFQQFLALKSHNLMEETVCIPPKNLLVSSSSLNQLYPPPSSLPGLAVVHSATMDRGALPSELIDNSQNIV